MIKKYIQEKKINKKVKQIAKKVYKDYKKYGEINIITVLIGAKYFAKDLIKELRRLGLKVKHDFVKAKSYSGTQTTGKVRILKNVKNVKNKNILIVEDIIDTGITLSALKKYLLKRKKAKSVKICTFLDKPSRRIKKVKVDYIGYKIPNKFVVGYGLDCNGKHRELKYIGVVVEN